jgi:hypothetical protein
MTELAPMNATVITVVSSIALDPPGSRPLALRLSFAGVK